MIFQHFNLISSATVYENIAFPLTLSKVPAAEIQKKVQPLLELVGLKDKANQYPAQLSGGQKQRVGIARALASNPKILLCDEATSALDPQTTKSILALIKDINKKLALTVVVITHEMQVIKEICDKVAVISNGVIAERGSVLEVFTNPQQPITKEFISVLLSNELPAAFRGNEISATKTAGSLLLLRLIFLGDKADDPVLAEMIRNFPGVECTMLFGNLDEIHGVPFGRFIIGLSGDENSVQNALEFLGGKEVRVEVIGYVKRNSAVTD
jgi:D-methionine transport system ATP-binding protein